MSPFEGKGVAILATSYPRSPEDASGHFVEAHAIELAQNGARVIVLAPDPTPPPIAVEPGSIRLVPLGGDALFAWPGALERLRESPARALAALPFAARAVRAVRELEVDRLVAHWLVPCAWPLAMLSRAPLEAWAHGADVRLLCAAPARLRCSVVASLVDRDVAFRFVAHELLDRLQSALPATLAEALLRRTIVEPAPIRVPRREELKLPDLASTSALEAGYLVWVGRLVASKRPEDAAAIAARVGVPLVVIGDGPMDPPHGTFALGRLPRRETLSWIAHARALISTSREEGAPTVIREARALGVPAIAAPAGDIERWARDDSGITVARGNDAMVGALAGVL